MPAVEESQYLQHRHNGMDTPRLVLTDLTGTLGVAHGGTGATTFTDGGLLLGNGVGAIQAMAVLANGEIVIGDGTTDPVALAAFTSSVGTLKHEYGGVEADISAVVLGGLVVGTGTGTMGLLAVGTNNYVLTADSAVAGGMKWASTIGGFTIGATNLAVSTNILMDASARAFYINSATFGNQGIQLEYNGGTPRAYIGNGSTQFFQFSGTTISWGAVNSSLDATGKLTTTSALIGGWIVASTTIADNATAADAKVLIDSANTLIRLGPTTGNYITLDGNNLRMRSSNYVTGVSGFTIEPTLVEAENIIARGIMKGSTFQYDIISAIGGQIIVANSDVLASDMTAADASTLTTRGTTTWAVNDIIVMRAVTAAGILEEWMRVTNIGSAPTYTVTRDLAAQYAADDNPVWQAGTPLVKQGSSDGAAAYSGGWLRLFGEGTNSPYYSVFSRTGVAYNAYTEVCRLGNLNGFLDYATALFGIAIGETDKHLKYDSTNGLRVAGALRGQEVLTANEAIAVGKAVYIRSSDGRSEKTDSTDYTKAEGYIGFAYTAAGGAASSHIVQTSGKVSGFSGLTAGRTVYLAKTGTTDTNISETDTATDYNTHNGAQALVMAYTLVVSQPAQLSSIAVKWAKTGTPGNLKFKLFKGAQTGNAPLGTEPQLASFDYSAGDVATGAGTVLTLDFNELTLEAGTYYLVGYVSSGTNDGSNYYSAKGDAGGSRLSQTVSGTAWGAFDKKAYFVVTYLESNKTYATGDITQYFFTYPKIAGIAVSATEVFILDNDLRVGNGTVTISALGSTTVTLGFRPKKITVFAHANTGGYFAHSQGSYIQGVMNCVFTIKTTTGASQVYSSGVSVTKVWDIDNSGAAIGSQGVIAATDTGFIIICDVYQATTYLAYICEG